MTWPSTSTAALGAPPRLHGLEAVTTTTFDGSSTTLVEQLPGNWAEPAAHHVSRLGRNGPGLVGRFELGRRSTRTLDLPITGGEDYQIALLGTESDDPRRATAQQGLRCTCSPTSTSQVIDLGDDDRAVHSSLTTSERSRRLVLVSPSRPPGSSHPRPGARCRASTDSRRDRYVRLLGELDYMTDAGQSIVQILEWRSRWRRSYRDHRRRRDTELEDRGIRTCIRWSSSMSPALACPDDPSQSR